MHVIIRNRPNPLGRTRSEVERNLQSEGWQSLTGEQLDKVRHLEKKLGMREGFIRQKDVRI